MSRGSVLGDAIVTAVNDATFTLKFVAERKYIELFTEKSLKKLNVTVLTPTVTQETGSRGTGKDTQFITILVSKNVNPNDVTKVDELATVAEEIADFFRLTMYGSAVWMGSTITIPYDTEDLKDRRVFVSAIHLQYSISWRK